MLVLSRRESERILIGPDVTVIVTRIRCGHVRLGIEAPPDVVILREEVADRAEGRGSGTTEV